MGRHSHDMPCTCIVVVLAGIERPWLALARPFHRNHSSTFVGTIHFWHCRQFSVGRSFCLVVGCPDHCKLAMSGCGQGHEPQEN